MRIPAPRSAHPIRNGIKATDHRRRRECPKDREHHPQPHTDSHDHQPTEHQAPLLFAPLVFGAPFILRSKQQQYLIGVLAGMLGESLQQCDPVASSPFAGWCGDPHDDTAEREDGDDRGREKEKQCSVDWHIRDSLVSSLNETGRLTHGCVFFKRGG